MKKRTLEQQDNINTIAFIFGAAYFISAIALAIYISHIDMWVGDEIHPLAYGGHILLFVLTVFLVSIVGEFYLPESEKSLNSTEKGLYWFFEILGNAFDFESRTERPLFWIYILWSTVLYVGLEFISYITLYEKYYESSILNFANIYTIITLIPGLAVGARRLHDTGRSGWWQLLILTYVGIIVLIIFWAQESKNTSRKKTEDGLESLVTESTKVKPTYTEKRKLKTEKIVSDVSKQEKITAKKPKGFKVIKKI